MNVLVGDKIGLVKVINIQEEKKTNEFQNTEKESEILFLNYFKNKVKIQLI